MTRQYIGTKIVTAWHQEKDGKPGYGVKYADGYTSWSPREAFEEAYRPIEGEGQCLSFGDALHLLKQGKKVARAGWNGKSMFLFYVASWTYTDGKQDNYPNLPFIAMKTADDKVVPWLCSQTDALAEDWVVVQ